MYNESNLNNLALEHRWDMLREAEKERLIRFAKTNGESRVLLTARWIISLGRKLLDLSKWTQRNPGPSIKIDLMP